MGLFFNARFADAFVNVVGKGNYYPYCLGGIVRRMMETVVTVTIYREVRKDRYSWNSCPYKH